MITVVGHCLAAIAASTHAERCRACPQSVRSNAGSFWVTSGRVLPWAGGEDFE